jgi:hypothetical protein
VADGTENNIGGVAVAFEMAAAKWPSVFMCAITASIGEFWNTI